MPSSKPGKFHTHQQALNRHPVYAALRGLDDLRLFMAHHVFSVWDFMSLIKSLQQVVAPVRVSWVPGWRSGTGCARP